MQTSCPIYPNTGSPIQYTAEQMEARKVYSKLDRLCSIVDRADVRGIAHYPLDLFVIFLDIEARIVDWFEDLGID